MFEGASPVAGSMMTAALNKPPAAWLACANCHARRMLCRILSAITASSTGASGLRAKGPKSGCRHVIGQIFVHSVQISRVGGADFGTCAQESCIRRCLAEIQGDALVDGAG